MNDRFMECFGLEQTLKTTQFESSCYEQGHHQKRLLKSPVQPGLSTSNGIVNFHHTLQQGIMS